MVFVGDYSEELGEFAVEILYHSSDPRDGDGGSVLKPFLGDGFVEVLSFIVSIGGCFRDLIDIETQPEGYESQKPRSSDRWTSNRGDKGCFQNFWGRRRG